MVSGMQKLQKSEGLITYILKNIFIWLSRALVAGIFSLRCTASLVVAHGLQMVWVQLPCSMCYLSSLIRDQTQVPCIAR